MNRTREIIFMGIGILTGITLCGPAAQAATALTATLSSQPIYVNGQRVSMTAYTIGGNNYVKLRDIGRAVDFGVTYDAATNSVYIDPGAPGHLPHQHPLRRSLPLYQQWPLRSIFHQLRGLGHPLQRRRLWQPSVAAGGQAELGADQGR